MAKFIHIEIPAEEPEKMLEFYSKVFGWTFSKWGDMPYWIFKGGTDSEPGINGAIIAKSEGLEQVVNTIGVADINQTVKLIEANGGKLVSPVMDIPGVGTFAYFVDNEGNRHGVIQEIPS